MKTATIESFSVSGSCVRTNNAQESTASRKLPGLWAQFYQSHPALSQTVYGVYSDYESDASGDYTVTAGTRTEFECGARVTLESGTYLQFPAEGEMPEAIIAAWRSVWAFFAKDQPYERLYRTDFEAYDGPASATVFIGVKARS